jgi:hypothetical protein
MLAASRHAAYCLPTAGQIETTTETRELDHVLAVHFGWWDVLIEKKKPVDPRAAGSGQLAVNWETMKKEE